MRAKSGISYFPVFPDDFLGHIMHSCESTLVSGARLRLWCHSTRETPVGTLPDDPKRLAMWAGVSLEEWNKEIGPAVTADWKLAGGRWHIRRIIAQYNRIQQKRISGSTGAKARWHKDANAIAPAIGTSDGTPTVSANGKSIASKPSQAIPIPSHSNPIQDEEKEERQIAPSQDDGSRFVSPEVKLVQDVERARRAIAVNKVWDYWLKTMERNPNLNTLTTQRKKLIERRLRDFREWEDPVAVLLKAIDACRASPFHMGENDQKRKYNSLDRILKTKEKVEGWLNRLEERGT